MTTAKKLICGHLFHVHCLRSWLERQHTCPTCRALVVPPENGTTAAAGGQQGSQSNAHQQGKHMRNKDILVMYENAKIEIKLLREAVWVTKFDK